jgi:glycosyltransferase involved in cell wall biosynthesis
LRLVHVVPHIDKEAAGPSYSVPKLCESLALRGHDVELSCLAARGDIPGVHLDIHGEWPLLRRFSVSTSHARAMRKKADVVDVVHNHSLWSMVNVSTGMIVPSRRARLVTSPRGTLNRWALARTRNLKRILRPFQWPALERADLLHATSEVELTEIRDQGLRAPVAIIPNGIDLPALAEPRTPRDVRTLLFLSRIHPVKGVDRLLQAWRRVQDQQTDWRLMIAGPGDPGYVREMTDLVAALKLDRVEFSGPLYGANKAQAYRDADLFILPTHTENFGMVIAEALAHQCPVVVSRRAPWPGIEAEGCGWWIEHDVDTLADTLDAAMRLPPERLRIMGDRGRAWMERDFSWSSVAEKMEAAYAWLLEGGSAPPSIMSS